MQPEGEAIAGRVDRADERCKPPGPKTQDVKHGSKHLASKLCNIVNLDNGRCDKCADRKSTRELQSLMHISYAVFCSKKINLAGVLAFDSYVIGPVQRSSVHSNDVVVFAACLVKSVQLVPYPVTVGISCIQ